MAKKPIKKVPAKKARVEQGQAREKPIDDPQKARVEQGQAREKPIDDPQKPGRPTKKKGARVDQGQG